LRDRPRPSRSVGPAFNQRLPACTGICAVPPSMGLVAGYGPGACCASVGWAARLVEASSAKERSETADAMKDPLLADSGRSAGRARCGDANVRFRPKADMALCVSLVGERWRTSHLIVTNLERHMPGKRGQLRLQPGGLSGRSPWRRPRLAGRMCGYASECRPTSQNRLRPVPSILGRRSSRIFLCKD